MWRSSLRCPVTLLNLTIKERKTRSVAKHTLVVRLPVQQTDQNAFFSDLHTTSQCLKKVHALLIHLSPPWKILTAAPWKTASEKTTIFFSSLSFFFLRRGVHMSCLLNLKRLVRTWPGKKTARKLLGPDATYVKWRDSQGHFPKTLRSHFGSCRKTTQSHVFYK